MINMQEIVIASQNPVKINCVTLGFEKVFPTARMTFTGLSVVTSTISNVSDQPMTNLETLTGAKNRVQAAKVLQPKADFWVGIEGGIETIQDQMTTFAWIVIADKNRIGIAKTGTFFIPPAVATLIKQGMELGQADDVIFGKSNSKQKNGAVGILTKDLLTRTSFYEPAVILALIPFVNLELFP